MSNQIDKRLAFFSENGIENLLASGKWGIERESLRVTGNGNLALTPHPVAFGVKTESNPITTDFSESQIELITPALDTIEKTSSFMTSLKNKADQTLQSELLWPSSMPGPLPDDETIPIARYDNSQLGKHKEIYRSGLSLRYGKKLQMISGIHYNFSFQEAFWESLFDSMTINNQKRPYFVNDAYAALIRNVLRYRWMLIYLFGASPVTNDSSLTDRHHQTATEYATSLRMSRYGYENPHQNELDVSFNSINDYIRDLRHILSSKNDHYAQLGVFKNGIQQQLNANELQRVDEFYSPVRFKQPPQGNESQLDALERRGINYVELRLFDLNPFEKNGFSLNQLYFSHAFMIFCLFENSSYLTNSEAALAETNASKTALMGRSEKLTLQKKNGNKVLLRKWGLDIIEKLKTIAHYLDRNTNDRRYGKSVEKQHEKLLNSKLLPSERIITEMKNNDESYVDFNLRMAECHRHKSVGLNQHSVETRRSENAIHYTGV